ncbi:MAG: MFS transporter [Candidatus Limnocylindrales bacterium]
MIVGGRVRFTAAGRALKHRNFRLFFFGQLISVTGTWMQSVALGWLLVTMVGSNQAIVLLGLLGVAQFLPVLVLGLFGGMIADIWPKRYTVIGTQTVAGFLALTLGALVYFNEITIWQIFVLAFLLGLVNAVDMPSRQSFVVEMVGPEDVTNAVALNSAVFNGARVVGPTVAWILIAVAGTASCFALNGLSYAAVVIGLLAMRDAELRPADRLAIPRSVGAVRENLGEGLRYVWHTPIVLLAIGVIGFVSTFGMNFNVVLPVLAGGVLNVGPNGLGLLYSAMGAGALIAALGVATLERPRVRVLVGGGMVLGVAELVLASTTSYPVALAAVFFAGVGAIATAATANTLVQITVPGALRGRVMSVYTTVFAGSTPIGSGLTGTFGGLWGTSVAIAMNGAVTLGAEAVAAIAVLRGAVPRIGQGKQSGREPAPAATTPGAGVPSVE